MATKEKKVAGERLDKNILASIAKKFAFYSGTHSNERRIKEIVGFTELRYCGELYRCHPSFRQSGQRWNDWAYFKWENTTGLDMDDSIEAQIHMFLDFRQMRYEMCPENVQSSLNNQDTVIENGLYCVVHSSDGISKYNNDRKLVTTLKMEPLMQIVNVDCIQAPAFVIHDKLKSYGKDTYLPEEVMSVISPAQWSEAFLEEE